MRCGRAGNTGFRRWSRHLRYACRAQVAGVVCLLILSGSGPWGCGRKGDPIPPERRLPAPPTQLQLAGHAGELVLTWSAPRRDQGGDVLDSVSAYRVWRAAWPPGATVTEGECPTCPQDLGVAAEIDAEALAAAGQTATRWIDPRTEPDWTYRYQVQALISGNRPGPLSAPAHITWVELPAPRMFLEARDRGALARFSRPDWPDGVTPLGYRIYDDAGRLLTEQELPADAVAVGGMENCVEVELSGRLAARTSRGWVVEGPGSSAWVIPVDRIPPFPPSDLTSFATPQGVRLRWLPAGREPYAGITVLRGPGEESLAKLAELPGTALGYLDTIAEPGRRYFYTVLSRDAAGNVSLQPRAVTGMVAAGNAPLPGEPP